MKIQSYSDIITNSSSELFVFDDGKSLQEVICELNKIYPDWRNEYAYPSYVKDSDLYNVSYYLEYDQYSFAYAKEAKMVYERKGYKPYAHVCGMDLYHENLLPEDFDKNDCYAKSFAEELGGKPEELYTNWETYNPFDNEWENKYLEFSDYCLKLFREKHGKEIMLFSLDENPNWEYQEKLMEVAKRYHLG